MSLFDYFLVKLAQATEEEPLTMESLQETLGLQKPQLTDWLKRAQLEGKAHKYAKPVRYDAGQRGLKF
jgi:predicted Rossmann fold nucleotide-binding protein DprA/Smf involved in DNA uptake